MKPRLIVGLVVASCLTGAASAQVVREDGVKSIAGAVGDGVGFVEWTFNTEGNEILFASLDAFVYEQRITDHELAAEPGGGCSGEEGGPSRLCLQVIDSATSAVLCHAKRPTPPPGWQRDPRLACELPRTPVSATYRVRVIQVSMGEHEGISCSEYDDTGLTTGDRYPFLLNVSLRRLAPSGVNIQAAIAQSLSRF